MLSEVEREAHRRVTAAWVESDPVTIVLRRKVRTSDGAGGTVSGGMANLPPQTFRMDGAANERSMLTITPEARTNASRYRLVGELGADVEEGDDFEFLGHTFDVIGVQRPTYERVVAEVMLRV